MEYVMSSPGTTIDKDEWNPMPFLLTIEFFAILNINKTFL
jgi:hypothetical protein